MAEAAGEGRRRVTLELSLTRIAHLDALKREWGIRNRGDVLERLLDEIFGGEEEDGGEGDGGEGEGLSVGGSGREERSRAGSEPSAAADASTPGSDRPGASDSGEADPAAAIVSPPHPRGVVPAARTLPDSQTSDSDLDERTALVLVRRGGLSSLELEPEPAPEQRDGDSSWAGSIPPPPRGGSGGIDLPGFVRRRSQELKRDLQAARRPAAPTGDTPLPQLAEADVHLAMETARDHWLGLYGRPADPTVLEAAMVWLAKEIWPQSDLSEGNTFTWTAACQLMERMAPGWSPDAPSFERVITTAGVLEDPFSGSTLAVRIPTLIRRFVQRFRRRRRGTSFQTLEHTMTLQGALKLLQLPMDPGQRVTLAQIRDAYRLQALNHHPDSGGSEESMRRLNEAYQLLKELYRRQA